MSRCDYEGVFYRVFCIGLLVIAFTFTVILTNVFIDIDGILSRKEHEFAKQENAEHTTHSKYDPKAAPDYYTDGEKNYDDIDGAYRTKRSLDSPKFLVHIRSTKTRHALANRLVSLLSELDNNEESITRKRNNDEFNEDLTDIYVPTKHVHNAKDVKQTTKKNKTEITNSDKSEKEKITGDILHLAIHNILLQGIVKHVDSNVVYDKVNTAVQSFKNEEKDKQENKDRRGDQATNPFEPSEAVVKILDELTNCKTLGNDIREKQNETEKQEGQKTTANHQNVFTYIDLPGKNINKNSKENITGVIKLIYDGQSIKVKNVEETKTTTKANTEETTPIYITKDVEEITEILKEDYKSKRVPKNYMTTMLQDVLNKLIIADDTNKTGASNNLRHKRHVEHHKKSKVHKKDDDEVFVEIETHFDATERKGKKKKELVKQLIEKILKALHSNGKDKEHKREHVTKRIQNPFNLSNHIIDNKYLMPYDISMYTRRELHPISKVAAIQEPLPNIGDKNGDDWKREDYAPKFFSPSKSINSAEYREVEVGYSKVLKVNDVLQRLQIPLNSDLSDENVNTYLDLGRLQYLIKDLEGTGFSVGLNQYVDQIPDSESIGLFTGLENLIKTYHQYYDQGNDQNDHQNNVLNYDQNYIGPEEKSSDIVYKHEMKKRDIQINRYGQRVIKKKSVRDNFRVHTKSTGKINDYNSNEYKIIFDKKKQPYNNYEEILENKHKRTLLSLNNNRDKDEDKNGNKGQGLQIDFNKIMEKKLTPSEIFSLADLLNRKRRSYNFHKISNLKTKIKVNRYLNTNAKAKPKPKILLNNKRNKRQIDKVRIITEDLNSHSDSDENVYIFSNENVFADSTLMRHESLPNFLPDANKSGVHEKEAIGDAKPPVYSVYEEINPLMSKYPHIFVDDFTISEFTDDTPTVFGRVLSKAAEAYSLKTSTETEEGRKFMDDQMPKVQDLVRALEPHTNYKFTIKLIPEDKVSNHTKEGFKEVHTSINKTFNKNGIHYSSLVNVSEISKIENNENIGSKIYDDYELDKNGIKSTTEKCCSETKAEEVTKALNEHKERSGNLNKQNETINPIILNNTRQVNNDLIDILLPLNPPRTIRFSKDSLGQLLLKSLQINTPTTPRLTTKKPEVVPHETTPKEVDPIKLKLLKAISQNERLTNLVLTKIDRNTGLLETFLNKVVEKIESLPEISQKVVKVIEPKVVNHPVPLQIYTRRQNNIETGPRLPFPHTYTNNQQNKTERPDMVNHEYVNPGSNKKRRVLKKIPFNENIKYFVDEDDHYMKRYISAPEFENLDKHGEIAAEKLHRPLVDTFIDKDNNKGTNNNKGQELKVNAKVLLFTRNPASGKDLKGKNTTLQVLNYGRDINFSPTAMPEQEQPVFSV